MNDTGTVKTQELSDYIELLESALKVIPPKLRRTVFEDALWCVEEDEVLDATEGPIEPFTFDDDKPARKLKLVSVDGVTQPEPSEGAP